MSITKRFTLGFVDFSKKQLSEEITTQDNIKVKQLSNSS